MLKYLIFAMLVLGGLPGFAQESRILWSAFTTGFGSSTGENTTITAAIGQPLVGESSDGNSAISTGFFAFTNPYDPVTSVEEPLHDRPLPTNFELEQNYPNPFNPATSIQFALPEAAHVKLEVFNLLGQKVVTLINEERLPGYYNLIFNATGFASGVYIYRLSAGSFIETRKMLLIQ